MIDKDDCINFMRLTYGTTINSILLKTFKGKSLNCMSYYEGEYKAEYNLFKPDFLKIQMIGLYVYLDLQLDTMILYIQ